jgi:hypothetical protein
MFFADLLNTPKPDEVECGWFPFIENQHSRAFDF